MRAARLLQMLLLLQNRGRMTSASLAEVLEVSTRTILRDIDAMTEAGLPVIVFQGNQGGIELGFDYRTRLMGLDTEEAAAMGLMLSATPQPVADLGLRQAADRARTKIWEAFPDQTRQHMAAACRQFTLAAATPPADTRIAAIAQAIRDQRIIRLQAATQAEHVVHPVLLRQEADGWVLRGAAGADWPQRDWGSVNISARRFAPMLQG